MRRGAAVKLVRMLGDCTVTFQDGTSKLYPADTRAWLPLSARISGSFAIEIPYAESGRQDKALRQPFDKLRMKDER